MFRSTVSSRILWGAVFLIGFSMGITPGTGIASKESVRKQGPSREQSRQIQGCIQEVNDLFLVGNWAELRSIYKDRLSGFCSSNLHRLDEYMRCNRELKKGLVTTLPDAIPLLCSLGTERSNEAYRAYYSCGGELYQKTRGIPTGILRNYCLNDPSEASQKCFLGEYKKRIEDPLQDSTASASELSQRYFELINSELPSILDSCEKGRKARSGA